MPHIYGTGWIESPGRQLPILLPQDAKAGSIAEVDEEAAALRRGAGRTCYGVEGFDHHESGVFGPASSPSDSRDGGACPLPLALPLSLPGVTSSPCSNLMITSPAA